ncbi:hypothetical protein OIE62_07175 [Streptomyces scopuliridis]|uniref:Uncharacterized protein n=1 Tax=Streptomyces scopuliridis TaxID=452529 RepID=A0ACD4ZT01_9ACTN|nr:hypothetical protein [Streptomyces scopuliridis]WSC01643.1 hypothetical protein OG835_34645 [Streptomyces scopuliridis]WSC04818.1 hypothetical protein OIE62_07175 [Streptomyces scopuliridis]
MTLIMDDLRRWQHETGSGPEMWQAAWERVIALVDPLWHDHARFGSDMGEAEAAAALTVALYILAAERDVSPADVTRADVEQFVDRPVSAFSGLVGYPKDLPERWSARLAALGHDLESDDDPVAVCWRRLLFEYPEPPDSFLDAGDGSLHRVGPAVTEGMCHVLAPIYQERLQF